MQLGNEFAECIVPGLKKATRKEVNFQKFQEVMQKKDETPSEFLDRFSKALQQYTNLDPETPDGRHVLKTYFLSQSYPDIKPKLKKKTWTRARDTSDQNSGYGFQGLP